MVIKKLIVMACIVGLIGLFAGCSNAAGYEKVIEELQATVAYQESRLAELQDIISLQENQLAEMQTVIEYQEDRLRILLIREEYGRYFFHGLKAEDIRRDLMQNNHLIPIEGVLGGTPGFYFEEQIYVGDWFVLAYAEDGHWSADIFLTYRVENPEGPIIVWTVVAYDLGGEGLRFVAE